MALYLVLAFAVLLGQVQSQEDIDVWDREFDFGRDRFDTRDEIAEGCFSKVADIFFILDSSTSIYINDYRQVLQFVRDVVARLDIGPRTTRVGLLSFSDDITRPPLELNRYQTKSELLASITELNLPYRTGVTNTDLAIRYVRESRLFRDDIVKIIIVVTDGGSRSPWLTTREAELAREQGFYLYVIGVGQYLDEREWRSIATDPDDLFVFNVSSFRTLDQIKYTLPPRACVLPPLNIFRRCDVTRDADVFFVAGPSETSRAVQVIDKFIETTNDQRNNIQASYLLDICTGAESVPLSSFSVYCDRAQVPLPATTETYVQLLSRVRAIARQSRRGGVKQVAVLFLDEDSLRLNREGLLNEARYVGQVDNIEIVVVDLGVRFPVNVAQIIASSRDNVVNFTPGSVAGQRTALKSVIDRTCTIINRETFTFRFTPR